MAHVQPRFAEWNSTSTIGICQILPIRSMATRIQQIQLAANFPSTRHIPVASVGLRIACQTPMNLNGPTLSKTYPPRPNAGRFAARTLPILLAAIGTSGCAASADDATDSSAHRSSTGQADTSSTDVVAGVQPIWNPTQFVAYPTVGQLEAIALYGTFPDDGARPVSVGVGCLASTSRGAWRWMFQAEVPITYRSSGQINAVLTGGQTAAWYFNAYDARHAGYTTANCYVQLLYNDGPAQPAPSFTVTLN
jgi:hypothetical protein